MKRKKIAIACVLIVFASLCTPLSLFAQIPEQLSYQGRLTTSAGLPVEDGLYTLKFSIYETIAATKALWSETQAQVTVTGGIFNTMLPRDTANAFPDSLFKQALYVGITVNNDAEMLPRLPLAATPFAFLAKDADKLAGHSLSGLDSRYVTEGETASVSSAMIVDGTITSDDLAESYITAASLPFNQPFQFDGYNSSTISGPTSLAIGVSSPLVPAGKRLVIQHISFNLSTTGIEADPVCDVDVLNYSTGSAQWVVTHTLQPVRYERAYSRISYISSQPLPLYAEPDWKIQVGCSAVVTENTSLSAALTGYFVDL